MHGDYMSGSWVRSWFNFESGPSFIVVYPDAHTSWDIEKPPSENLDLRFVDALLADVKTKACVDRHRVFAFGNSNGAYFVNNLGCFRGDVFRGVMAVSGGGPASDNPLDYDDQGLYRWCSTPPTSALVLHGTADPKIKFEDGRASRDYWRIKNQCQESYQGIYPGPCIAYDGCTTGNTVAWCELGGFGHDVWDGTVTAAWTFFDMQKP
jgi:polyhydroxybutyrate depolymerase